MFVGKRRGRCLGRSGGGGREAREGKGGFRTSAASAVSSVSMAALGANADYLSVDVFGVVGGDVAGATAAVRDVGSRHVQ